MASFRFLASQPIRFPSGTHLRSVTTVSSLADRLNIAPTPVLCPPVHSFSTSTLQSAQTSMTRPAHPPRVAVVHMSTTPPAGSKPADPKQEQNEQKDENSGPERDYTGYLTPTTMLPLLHVPQPPKHNTSTPDPQTHMIYRIATYYLLYTG